MPQNGKIVNGNIWDTYPLIPKSCPESLPGLKILNIDNIDPIVLPKGIPATGHKVSLIILIIILL